MKLWYYRFYIYIYIYICPVQYMWESKHYKYTCTTHFQRYGSFDIVPS